MCTAFYLHSEYTGLCILSWCYFGQLACSAMRDTSTGTRENQVSNYHPCGWWMVLWAIPALLDQFNELKNGFLFVVVDNSELTHIQILSYKLGAKSADCIVRSWRTDTTDTMHTILPYWQALKGTPLSLCSHFLVTETRLDCYSPTSWNHSKKKGTFVCAAKI